MVTIKKEKGRQYTLEERRTILRHFLQYKGKEVIVLGLQESRPVMYKNKLKIYIGTLEDVKWDAFSNYAVFTLIDDKGVKMSVDASRMYKSLFEMNEEGVKRIISIISCFIDGEEMSFLRDLDRKYCFETCYWSHKTWSKSLNIGEDEQLFYFNKSDRTIEVVLATLECGEISLSNGQRFSILEEYPLKNTEKEEYYIYDDLDKLLKSVKRYLLKHLEDTEELEEGFGLSDELSKEANNQIIYTPDQIKNATYEVINEMLPEIVERILKKIYD